MTLSFPEVLERIYRDQLPNISLDDVVSRINDIATMAKLRDHYDRDYAPTTATREHFQEWPHQRIWDALHGDGEYSEVRSGEIAAAAKLWKNIAEETTEGMTNFYHKMEDIIVHQWGGEAAAAAMQGTHGYVKEAMDLPWNAHMVANGIHQFQNYLGYVKEAVPPVPEKQPDELEQRLPRPFIHQANEEHAAQEEDFARYVMSNSYQPTAVAMDEYTPVLQNPTPPVQPPDQPKPPGVVPPPPGTTVNDDDDKPSNRTQDPPGGDGRGDRPERPTPPGSQPPGTIPTGTTPASAQPGTTAPAGWTNTPRGPQDYPEYPYGGPDHPGNQRSPNPAGGHFGMGRGSSGGIGGGTSGRSTPPGKFGGLLGAQPGQPGSGSGVGGASSANSGAGTSRMGAPMGMMGGQNRGKPGNEELERKVPEYLVYERYNELIGQLPPALPPGGVIGADPDWWREDPRAPDNRA